MSERSPTPEQSREAAKAVNDMIGTVIYCCAPDGTKAEAVTAARRILDRMTEHRRAVIGNRHPERTVVTWADMRLLLAGELRILVEELEDGPCP